MEASEIKWGRWYTFSFLIKNTLLLLLLLLLLSVKGEWNITYEFVLFLLLYLSKLGTCVEFYLSSLDSNGGQKEINMEIGWFLANN